MFIAVIHNGLRVCAAAHTRVVDMDINVPERLGGLAPHFLNGAFCVRSATMLYHGKSTHWNMVIYVIH
jgi:hypothetical protein